MGDAKDYERVRSRIDDHRLLKGFLQVALGAESAAAWSRLPVGLDVHRSGVLAVPRNAFLQPEPSWNSSTTTARRSRGLPVIRASEVGAAQWSALGRYDAVADTPATAAAPERS